jgi:hypothetical protein
MTTASAFKRRSCQAFSLGRHRVIQLLTLVVGIVFVFTGMSWLMKGEFKLSPQKIVTGKWATRISFAVVLSGFAIVAFALIGFPLILR